jgi:hypothetical protein
MTCVHLCTSALTSVADQTPPADGPWTCSPVVKEWAAVVKEWAAVVKEWAAVVKEWAAVVKEWLL